MLKVDGGAAMEINFFRCSSKDILGIDIARQKLRNNLLWCWAFLCWAICRLLKDQMNFSKEPMQLVNFEPFLRTNSKNNSYKGWKKVVIATQLFAEIEDC